MTAWGYVLCLLLAGVIASVDDLLYYRARIACLALRDWFRCPLCGGGYGGHSAECWFRETP